MKRKESQNTKGKRNKGKQKEMCFLKEDESIKKGK